MIAEWRSGGLAAFLSAAVLFPAAGYSAESSAGRRDTEPDGWRDLLVEFGQWERVAYNAKRPLVENSPWKWDPATGILDCQARDIHEFLLFREALKDGVLHVEWRYVGNPAKPNSGVMVRTNDDASISLQAQLATAGLGMLSGAVGTGQELLRFKAGERLPELQRPSGEWNVMEVSCNGPEISLWINGRTIATMKDFPAASGRIGLEAEFHPIQFRNILFKPR